MSITRVQAIPIQALDASFINALTPTAINPNGLPNSIFLLRIINASNTPVLITYSTSGSVTADYVAANSTIQLPAQSNSKNGVIGNFPKGLVVSALGTAGVGSLYVAGYYISSEV